MEVILLDNVDALGKVGDTVKVSPGYGRNYLIPKGKALLATRDNLAVVETRRAELEAIAATALEAATKRAESAKDLALVIKAKAGSEGKLFGSVGPADIADAAAAAGVELNRSELRLPEGPIRAVGEYPVEVVLHPDVHLDLKVTVEADGGDAD